MTHSEEILAEIRNINIANPVEFIYNNLLKKGILVLNIENKIYWFLPIDKMIDYNDLDKQEEIKKSCEILDLNLFKLKSLKNISL